MPDSIENRLDDALRFPTSARIEALTRELGTDARRSATGRRSLFRWFSRRAVVTSGVVILLLTGATTTAVANPTILDWLAFTPDAGTTLVLDSGIVCQTGYRAHPDFVSDPHPEAAVARAQFYLRTLDLSSLPLSQRIDEIKADLREHTENWPAGWGTEESITSEALFDLVSDGMYNDLKRHGFTGGVSLEGATPCDDTNAGR